MLTYFTKRPPLRREELHVIHLGSTILLAKHMCIHLFLCEFRSLAIAGPMRHQTSPDMSSKVEMELQPHHDRRMQ